MTDPRQELTSTGLSAASIEDTAIIEPPPDTQAAAEAAITGQPDQGKPLSLWGDAWQIMRVRPLFWISAGLIVLFVVMAAFPQLFTSKDPRYCLLTYSRRPPSASAFFGYDMQGCDIYARTIYGARASILVGLLTASLTAALGAVLGTIAGYIGGWLDSLLSRIADIFFSIPLLLGAIVIMYSFPVSIDAPSILVISKVVIAMALLSWPNIFRLMRSSVMQVKPNEYVLAARALGAGPMRIVSSHVVPNSLAPVIVVATIDLGTYIATEATLSFLGVGLQQPVVSWGIAISAASALGYIRTAPFMLLFPALFLCLTVLAFIMMGEVVRDALDPKLR